MSASEVERLLATHGEDADRIVLTYTASDGTRVPCQRWEAPIDPVEALEQIEERALRQANTLGGSHVFWCELFDKNGRPIASEVFRVTAELMPLGASSSAEPANEGGHLAQMMRHNEGHFRLAIQSSRETAQIQSKLQDQALKMTTALANRLEAVESRYAKAMETVSVIITGEREAEIEAAKAAASAKLKADFGSRIMGLLPEAVAAIAGRKPEGAAAAAAIGAKGLFSSLNQEQLVAIMGVLKPEQQAAVMGLMKRLAAEEEAHSAPPDEPPTTH